MENKPLRTVKFIFNTPEQPEWVNILLSEVSKIAKVNVAFSNSPRKKSIAQFFMNSFLAFEKKLSPTLRTQNFNTINLTNKSIENDIDFDIIINLSSSEITHATRICINGEPLKNLELEPYIWQTQGSKIIVQAVRGTNTILEYQNSLQSFFITSRLNNIVASISDVVYYTIIKNNSTKRGEFTIQKKRYAFQLISYCLTYVFKIALIKINARLQREAWHIAIKTQQKTVVLKNQPHSFKADPFLFKYDNQIWLSYEELNYAESNKGYISVCNIKDSRDLPTSTKVIGDKTHFSYPYMLEYNNNLFCIPETKEKKEIALYRVNNVLHEWEKLTVLINDIEAVDTSLIYYQNKWWLFCTAKTTKLSNSGDALLIFSANSLQTSSWTPHPLNPVKLSNSSARQAGSFYFNQHQQLIRPVQDGSYTYGGSINLMRLDILNENDFSETLVQRINPKDFHPKAKAIHTINTVDQYTVVDLILNRKYVE